jgi:hypothetical protein
MHGARHFLKGDKAAAKNQGLEQERLLVERAIENYVFVAKVRVLLVLHNAHTAPSST